MRLTISKIEWINKKVDYYCNLLEITPPRVMLTRKEYEKWKLQKRQQIINDFKLQNPDLPISIVAHTRVGRSNYLGVCHREEGFIVLNVKAESTLKAIDNTIRHELIHYAKPSYNHQSQTFQDRMKKLKRGKIKNGRF